jgi:hypothetical protein
MKNWHWIVLGALAVLSLIIEFTMVEHHGDHWWSSIPAFYIFLGILGSILLIFLSRWLGKLFILSDEDYYDR